MVEQIKKFKEINWLGKYIITFLIGIVSATLYVSNICNTFNTKLDNMYNEIKVTKQMALKSVIWNEKVSLEERAKSCDVYLSSGYNSYTKMECEKILREGD